MTDGRSGIDKSGSSGSPGPGDAWSVLGTLIAGLAVWGGVGALLDWWWGTEAFVPIGLVVGMVAAIYLVVVKYGR